MTFQLVQQLAPNLESYRQRGREAITHCVIHRSGPWPESYGEPQDAQDLINIFCKEDLGTGFKMPYTFVFNPRTRIMYQTNYATAITPHASKWNKAGIGVAILADLRSESLSHDAYATLVKFGAYLRQELGRDLIFAGHTDLPGSTSDPNKECPGKMLDVGGLDLDVKLAQSLLYKV